MIPFIQRMIKNMQKIDFLIFFFISLLINGVWPVLAHYQPSIAFNTNFYMPLFESYICYLLLGYYLFNYSSKNKRKFLLALFGFGISLICSVIFTYFEYIKNGESYTFFSDRTLIFIALPSICLFYLCSFITGGDLQKVFDTIGRCTFGIYLLSDYFIGIYKPIYISLSESLPILLAMFFYQCMIFITGLLVSLILKQIPVIKSII